MMPKQSAGQQKLFKMFIVGSETEINRYANIDNRKEKLVKLISV